MVFDAGISCEDIIHHGSEERLVKTPNFYLSALHLFDLLS